MVRIVKDGQTRRAEIVAAACDLFLTQGYESTTMQDVMVRVKIAKGTIYHYFKSKDDLLEAVLDSLVDDYKKSNENIFDNLTGNALEKIEQFIVGNIKNDHKMEIIENLHQPANAGMHTRLHAKLISMQAPFYGELFRQGCDEGLFATEFPLESAEFILSAVTFLTDMGIYSWTEEQMMRRVAAIPALIENQLRAPVDSFDFLITILQQRHT